MATNQAPLRIIRLLHTQITIPIRAEDEARHFYCDVLGLEEIAKPATLAGRGGFWLYIGDIQIHVGAEDGVDRLVTNAHLAYEVANLAAWREHLEGAKCAILEGIPIPGYDRFETRDPLGNRIEFISPES